MGFRMLRCAGAVLAVLLLAGCVPGEPVITPEPDPDVTPIFASDEEALAAATEAYARYLEVSDQIAADGGADPERMIPVVSTAQYLKEVDGFEKLQRGELHIVGASKFDTVSLQSWSMVEPSVALVVIYACSDASLTSVLDASGKDVTPESRPDRTPFELEFSSSSDDERSLVLSRSDLWTGADFC